MIILSKTDPKYVSFEIDILWTFFPQDPAKLIRKIYMFQAYAFERFTQRRSWKHVRGT
jgi:hypothetical protein